MKQPLTALVAVAATALLTVACAKTDAGVTTELKAKFAADDAVKAYQINIDTKDHVVTLTGQVDSDAAKARAIEIARAGDGVREVVDLITIRTSASAMPGLDQAASDVANAARDASNAVGDAARDASNAVGDAATTASVKSKLLANSEVGGLRIDVDTKNGVVTLTGDVKSAAEKTIAVRIARTTDGVKSVEDHLAIKP